VNILLQKIQNPIHPLPEKYFNDLRREELLGVPPKSGYAVNIL